MNREDDERLAAEMGRFADDPLGFVMYAFDWGEGDLAHFTGPDDWARELLEEIAQQVRENGFDGARTVQAIRVAIASGHGIGKSAMTAWIILWIMSTRPYAKGVVTANTSAQLETKTWAELLKWRKRCITGHWFNHTGGKGSMMMYHKDHRENWFVSAQTCAKENAEAFAGQHAVDSTSFYIFDEASAVPDQIWEVAEGGLTDGEPMIFAFGNPTRNTGRFRECFGRNRHRWTTRQVDSRTVKITNKDQIAQWIADNGEDSDFVRVRVKGEFPRSGSNQFISSEDAEESMSRAVVADDGAALVLGVDVARSGEDQSVLFWRQGRNGRIIKPVGVRITDSMQLASFIGTHIDRTRPDGVFIDGGGLGGPICDRMRQLGFDVIEANFGFKADEPQRFANKRAEMWARMRDWIIKGGTLPHNSQLLDDLVGPEFKLNGRDQLVLEAKADMKKRGLSSPDWADGLALTFYSPVQKRGFADAWGWDSGDTTVADAIAGY